MRLLWLQTVPAPLRGLSLARERDALLVRDGRDGLILLDGKGAIQAQRSSPFSASTICAADDGGTYAVGGAEAAVCCLAPDLAPRWQRPLPRPATAIALEAFGRRLAVADADCTLHLFDSRGQTLWRATTPRPLAHLTFVPEKALVVGTADFGLIACFGADGTCVWRDAPVAHIGSLAVSGDGESIVLACFSEGLYRYGVSDPKPQRIPLDSACCLAALSYSGDYLLSADRDGRVCLRERNGDLCGQINLAYPLAALALGALGDFAVAGLADGGIRRIDTRLGEASRG